MSKGLGRLYDYTKFHIGVHLTLTGSYIAAANIKVNQTFVDRSMWTRLVAAITSLMCAG